MKPNLIAAALTATALCLAGTVFGQPNAAGGANPVHPGTTESFTHGESKRCETMTGNAKEQCDKEEATKTEGVQADEADAPREPAGSSAAAGTTGTRFTHGESKHCETMTGAAREQCDKQEATK